MYKYPRTPHVEGSRLQSGDNPDVTRLSELAGANCVLEEKLDGANSGVSFDQSVMQLQSRGHILTGGSRERHFNLFKQWASAHEDAFRGVLGDRFVMYGEWMYAKHSVFYNHLPHYFLEFDVFDKEKKIFLDTPTRHAMLQSLPVVHVPVVWSGALPARFDLDAYVGLSLARTPSWSEDMVLQATRQGIDPTRVQQQTDASEDGEGLYIKHEENGEVVGRYKYIRASFTQTILDNDEHWQRRPILPNMLNPTQDIFAPSINKAWPAFVPKPPRKKGLK